MGASAIGLAAAFNARCSRRPLVGSRGGYSTGESIDTEVISVNANENISRKYSLTND